MAGPTKQDLAEFRAYVRTLTTAQVTACLAKESVACRGAYAQVCADELLRRDR